MKKWCGLLLAALLIFFSAACSTEMPMEETEAEVLSVARPFAAYSADSASSSVIGVAGEEMAEVTGIVEDSFEMEDIDEFSLMEAGSLTATPAEDTPVTYEVYDIYSIDAGEHSVSEAEMVRLRALGYEANMTFGSDGSGMMFVAHQSSTFTYDASAMMADIDGSKVILDFRDDGMLLVIDGNDTIYLRKRP